MTEEKETPEVTPEAPAEAAAPQPVEAAAVQPAEAAPVAEKPKAAPKKTAKKGGTVRDVITIGRRKESVSRVKLIPGGKGEFTVNGKPLDQYFSRKIDAAKALQPFKILGIENTFNGKINVRGGGITGQAEAVRLGVARWLKKDNEAHHKPLKEAGLLTRDSRMVERKKYGLHKARRATQFSKR